MKELYIETINRFMESKQMKDYLMENIDILQGWQIVELVCGARGITWVMKSDQSLQV